MAELYGEKMASSVTPPPLRPKCTTVEASVPPKSTPPKEAEPNTASALKTRQSRQNLRKRPGQLLFSICPEEERQQKTAKVNRRRRKEQNQTGVHKTRSLTHRQPVTFSIPVTEEEKEEVKNAKMVFGDLLSKHQTPTQPTGGDIPAAPSPLKTTPPKEAEPSTALASETRQSRQNLRKRPGQLLFSIPPEEKRQQKKTPRRKEQNKTEVQKTRSQKMPTEPVSFSFPLTEEEKEEAKKANIVFGDFLSDHLLPAQPSGGDISEAPEPLKTTPLKEVHITQQQQTTPPQQQAPPQYHKREHKQLEETDLAPELAPVEVLPSEPRHAASPSPEETEEKWEEKDDKLDKENIEPETVKSVEQKSQYNEVFIIQKERKRYDREFLLSFQFVSASMRKTEGLPDIRDVILDKAPGPCRSQQGERKVPRKIITGVSLNNDVVLNKAEKAWKPVVKSRSEEDDPEMVKTQELYRKVRSILNKLTPQMFQQLMKQFMELTIDTEERLNGVVDLVFEKAISEPSFTVIYANMSRCLMGMKVPTSDKLGATVNFHRLLLNRCQEEFEKVKDDKEMFQQEQKELDAATEAEVHQLKQAHRRSIGNITFIGELFKLKMLPEEILHICIIKLLKNPKEESLECLCRLLSTIGKDLDFKMSKPHMDLYLQQMEKIIKERKTSSRIRFMLQDVLDLRKNNWVPRRGDQGPKTIDQIHREAELEEQREEIKVQQLLLSKKDCSQRRDRTNQPQDESWNTTPISKITKMGALNFNQPNHFSALQQTTPSSTSSSSSCMMDEGERGSRDRTTGTEMAVKHETSPVPPLHSPSKPALSEEEVEKKSTAIIEEYLHINDLKEAVQCVKELNSASVLSVFVRNAFDFTFERSTIAREHVGLLLHKLISTGILPPEQYFRGLQEILEVADDMAVDIPHVWLYLAEIITPMLHDGGIPMGLLFREVTKPLLPIRKAAVLLVHILNLLCKGLSHKKAGELWIDAGLNWKDFLPEDEDINKFVTEQKVEFTLGEEPEKPRNKDLCTEELSKNLDRLIQDKTSNCIIHNWVEENLDEEQMTSNSFIRVLMISVCQAAIICGNPYKVDVVQVTQRATLLQKYLVDEQKELQALYALQALMVQLEQPANLLRMFFDILYDEHVITEKVFHKWKSSKDPAELAGKDMALKSVKPFFVWFWNKEKERRFYATKKRARKDSRQMMDS